MIQRPLLEVTIDKSNFKDPTIFEQLIDWCDEHHTFAHADNAEYMYWIPPLDGCEKWLENSYGPKIPKIIKKFIVDAIMKTAAEEDAGFLLIVFSF